MWRQMKIRCHENAFWLGPISGAKHPHCHSLPSRAGGENMKNKSEKTFRSRHRQFNRWMKKETERAKKKKRQRKSLTTSYLQANAQPVTGNYNPHSSSSSTPVFTAEHDTACHRILPLWPVWASRLGLCLSQPVHQPGAEWEKHWCCTGTAQQKPEQWCYQHCSSHMSKTWPRSGC